MTDAEVIQVLAKREGVSGETRYLTSKDALQPILEKLSREERYVLARMMTDKAFKIGVSRTSSDYAFWFLSSPAKDLAHAIAEAVIETRK